MSTLDQAIEDPPDAPSEDIKEVKVDELEQLRNDLAAANKRISDTYAQYQAGQERMAVMERAHVERDRQANRPAILDTEPELQEAIRFVTESERNKPTEEDRWISVVARAIPDADSLMSDPAFANAAAEARKRAGEAAWKDPINAINALANLKAEYIKTRAIEEDRRLRQFEAERTDAMSIPGGSGKASRREAPVDGAKQIWDMPAAEFEKMRNKVMTG